MDAWLGFGILAFLLALVVLPGVLFAVGVVRWLLARRFVDRAVRARATVVGLPSRLTSVSTGNGGWAPLRVFEPVVQFYGPDGGVVEARVERGTPTPSAALGQETPVLYDPGQPARVRLAEADGTNAGVRLMTAGCAVAVVLLIAAGACVLIPLLLARP